MDNVMKDICPICKKRKKQKHFNAKYCKPCAIERRKRPLGKLTKIQERKALSMAGKVYRDEIAKKIGTSKANFTRWIRQHPEINFNALRYPENVVKEVCEYYAEHGKIKTQKKYPNVKVRSIVERYLKNLGYAPRQTPWTDKQLMMLVKMAGIISMKKQAEYFNRPNAHKGSIQSAWMKKFGRGGSSVNGLSWYIARHYADYCCPVLQTRFWVQRKTRSKIQYESARMLVLWVDLAKHMSDDIPEHLKAGIRALAKFQKWAHGNNVRKNIIKMIKEIEYGEKCTGKA